MPDPSPISMRPTAESPFGRRVSFDLKDPFESGAAAPQGEEAAKPQLTPEQKRTKILDAAEKLNIAKTFSGPQRVEQMRALDQELADLDEKELEAIQFEFIHGEGLGSTADQMKREDMARLFAEIQTRSERSRERLAEKSFKEKNTPLSLFERGKLRDLSDRVAGLDPESPEVDGVFTDEDLELANRLVNSLQAQDADDEQVQGARQLRRLVGAALSDDEGEEFHGVLAEVGAVGLGASTGFLQSINELAGFAGERTAQALSFGIYKPKDKPLIPVDLAVGEPQSMPGQMAKGVLQFAAGWFATGPALKGVQALQGGGRAATIGRGLVHGAAADLVAFESHEQRLSNLIQEFQPLRNPITEYLAADPNDSIAEGRLKNVLEGMGLGVAVEFLIAGVRSIRGVKAVRDGKIEPRNSDPELLNIAIDGTQKELEAAMKRAEPQLPKPGDVEARAQELFIEAGDASRSFDEFLEQAEKEVLERTTIKPLPKQEGAAKATPKPRSIKGALDSQKQQFLARIEKVKAGELDAEDAAVGIDFNFDKMLSDGQVKSALNWLSGQISDDVFKAKGGVQSFDEIRRGAERMGLDPNGLIADLNEAGAKAADLAKTKLAGIQLVQSLAKRVADEAAALRVSDTPAARESLGRLYDVWVNVFTNVKAIQTGAARTTAAGRIEVGGLENLVTKEAFDALSPSRQEAMIQALAQSGGDIGKVGRIMRRTWADKAVDKINFYFFNSLLSHPKTHGVNILSNAVESVTTNVETIIGGAISADRQAVMEGVGMMYQYHRSLGEAFHQAGRSAKQGQSILAPRTEKGAAGLGERSTAEGILNYVPTVVGLPTRALMTEDELFKQFAYRQHVRGRLWREAHEMGLRGNELRQHVADGLDAVVDSSGAGIDRAALDFAKDQTFVRDLDGWFLGGVQRFASKHPAIATLVPFARIAASLTQKVAARTPVIQFLSKDFRADLRSSDPILRSAARGKLVTSAGIWSFFGTMAGMGKITGTGPADPVQRKQLMDTGWQPNSFVTTDADGKKVYTPIGRIDPIAAVPRIMGNLAEVIAYMPEEEADVLAQKLIAGTARAVAASEWMGQTGDLIGAFTEGDHRAHRWLQRYSASYIPTGLRAFNDDPHFREVESAIDAWKQRIPGLSDTLPPERNIFGEPRVMPPGYHPQTMNPFASSKEIDDDVKKELSELNHAFSMPPKAEGAVEWNRFVNPETGQDAYDRLVELGGGLPGRPKLHEVLSKIVKSPSYQKMPNVSHPVFKSRRVQMIAGPIAEYRQAARQQVLQEYPDLREALIAQQIAEQQIQATGSLPDGAEQ